MTKQFNKTLCIILILLLAFGFGIQANRVAASEEGEDHYKYYRMITVEEGDTISSIAKSNYDQKYGTMTDYMNEICDMNDLHDDKIQVGQQLVISYYSDELK